ncbi:MAG: 6-bladed beta-propeller [Gemmatimonadota bacterium]|nr:6-bladed beta-propeller [Gemmatimonadota bacterium]MDE2873250.1 6-bladed beta-propeller [Gemmatimonadota bacterium]
MTSAVVILETVVYKVEEDKVTRSDLPRLLSAIAASALAACADTGSYASGQAVVTEIIGDTTVVRTLSGSVWEGGAALVPEVSIGELDGPEELLFGGIRSIAVDDDHNVYVFDRQAQHVRVFDPDGVYLETLGRPGEGPGEFSRAEAIAMLPDGRSD